MKKTKGNERAKKGQKPKENERVIRTEQTIRLKRANTLEKSKKVKRTMTKALVKPLKAEVAKLEKKLAKAREINAVILEDNRRLLRMITDDGIQMIDDMLADNDGDLDTTDIEQMVFVYSLMCERVETMRYEVEHLRRVEKYCRMVFDKKKGDLKLRFAALELHNALNQLREFDQGEFSDDA